MEYISVRKSRAHYFLAHFILLDHRGHNIQRYNDHISIKSLPNKISLLPAMMADSLRRVSEKDRNFHDDEEEDDDDDDDGWDTITHAIKSRDAAQNVSGKTTEVLDIDSFFEDNNLNIEPNEVVLQAAIERSLERNDISQFSSIAPASPPTPSSKSQSPVRDSSSATPLAENFESSSGSCSSGTFTRAPSSPSALEPRKYHTATSMTAVVNNLSDEMLSRILNYVEKDGERVCRRWMAIRIKLSRTKMVDALAAASGLPRDISMHIESELFSLFSGHISKQYKMQARSLLSNLKSNAELKDRVANGLLIPRELVRMTSKDMATKDLTQKREAWITEKFVQSQQSRLLGLPRMTSKLFSCLLCGHDTCEIYQQRRGAIHVVDRIHVVKKCLNCEHYFDQ